MTHEEREDLLWTLASQARAGEGSARLTDRDLERYRSGTMDPEDEKEIELTLATDRKTRERLAELAGVKLPNTPLELRERILRSRPGASRSTGRFGWGQWWPGYAAAAAALSLLLFIPLLRPQGLPTDLAFDLHAQGLASARSQTVEPPSPSSSIEAYPDTRVQIRIEPRGEARAGLAFSVFRRDGDLLRYLPPTPPLSLEVVRGAALLAGPAAALVRSPSGQFDFFFVVHSPDDTPATEIMLEGNDPLAALAGGKHRRVYPWQIRLLPATSDEHSLEEK